jgi:hypothetical protein
MIRFQAFIEAIHEAIISASDTLMAKNEGILDKYFDQTTHDVTDPTTNVVSSKSTLVPKSVILEYPVLNADGKVDITEVHVPLITMVPLALSQIEKATLTAEFEMEIVDGEVQLNFTTIKAGGLFKKNPKTTTGKIEIVITPQESTEGLKQIVEGYEAILKRQLS